MKEDDRFIPFFEAYKDDFFESMEDVRMYLKNNNFEYQNIEQKLHDIVDNNINAGDFHFIYFNFYFDIIVKMKSINL